MTQSTLQPTPSLPALLLLSIKAWLYKTKWALTMVLLKTFLKSKIVSVAPTYPKRYNARPNLTCQVFIPASYEKGQHLPLYIDIHGGGWTLFEPLIDYNFCHFFANKFNHVVISLSYRLAPRHPFPVGQQDCLALIQAILNDDQLPIDRAKIVLGGFSAGANLALTVAQHPSLHSQIKALVAIYPSCDLSGRFAGSYRDQTLPNGTILPDPLRKMHPICSWCYIPFGHDLTDPLLSPIYASAKDLPYPIFFIGCQHDKVCREAWLMAKKLAGMEQDEREEEVMPESKGWEKRGIRWERIEGEVHAFNQAYGDDDESKRKLAKAEDMYGRIAAWLPWSDRDA